jgi:nitrogen PTS system EIIA component
MHFGAALRVLRTDAGVSLRQLAAQVGVSSAYLSRVEHGRDQAPTADRLTAIARVLGLPPVLLLELADRVSPFVADYLERVPAASALFLDIARRRLSPAQLVRIRSFIDREFPTPSTPSATRLGKLLTVDRIVLGLSCRDFDDALDIAASTLTLEGRQDARRFSAALREREDESSTALGDGVAAPHAVYPGARAQASMVLFAEPLDHPTPDGRPLRVLVALLLEPNAKSQLEVLAQVARLASPEVVDALCEATTPRDAIRIVAARLL